MMSIGDFARLGQVSVRMLRHYDRIIDKENEMSETEYVVKTLPTRSLAARRASVESQAEIPGVVEPLFGGVAAAIGAAGGCPETGVAVYEIDGTSPEDGLRIIVGYDYAGAPAPGFEVVALPAVDQCVCAVHLGTMETIGDSWQALIRWLETQGWSPAGPGREVYLRAWPPEDQSEWVTELQQPVRRR
ncbi:GyrI-like domain-containing protein [uncultured Friedmanniella sp.]|uniref:MerR family transcriptional regulator n=1 Tax=uncultured Friedmanniella sp. TaxID=335381 RepID=UPI0035CA8D1D